MKDTQTRWRSVAFSYLAVYPLTAMLMWSLPHGYDMAVPLALVVLPTVFLLKPLLTLTRTPYLVWLAHAALTACVALATVPFSGAAWPLAAAVAAWASAVGLAFLHPDARHAHMSTAPRGVRRFKRFPVSVAATLMAQDRIRALETHDLSEGGAYLHGDSDALAVGERVSVTIQARDGSSRWLGARVIAINPHGVGTKPPGLAVEFINVAGEERAFLRDVCNSARRHRRCVVSLPVELHTANGVSNATTVDVSEGGCFIAPAPAGLGPGDTLVAHLQLHEGDSLELLSEVLWHSDGQGAGLALRFTAIGAREEEAIRVRLTGTDVTIESGIAA